MSILQHSAKLCGLSNNAGKVMPNTVPRFTQRPNLIMVQPFAVMMGEKVKLTLKGHNLRSFGTR
jgi:hypothetical protein